MTPEQLPEEEPDDRFTVVATPLLRLLIDRDTFLDGLALEVKTPEIEGIRSEA